MSQEGGPLFAGMTAMFDARTQAQAYKASARVDEVNARGALLEGALATEDIQRRGRAVQGEAISALAEYGSVGGQSAQDLLFQNQLEIEHQVLNTRYSAATEARALKFSANQKRKAATASIIRGIMGVGAAAVSGTANAQSRADVEAAQTRRENAAYPGSMRLPAPPSGRSSSYNSSFFGMGG